MADPPQNLFEQQESNRRRSFWLVTGFVLFFAWVGFGGDIAWYLMSADAPAAPGARPDRHTIPFIGILATLVAGGICWYSWKKGPERVLWATGLRRPAYYIHEDRLRDNFNPAAINLMKAGRTPARRGRRWLGRSGRYPDA